MLLLRDKRTREQGFRLLMHRYQQRLYGHIRRMVYSHDDANDVLQNCLLKAYRHLDRFQGQSALYTWLYRIATNETLTFLKRQQRRSARTVSDGDAAAGAQLQAEAAVDGEAVQRQLAEALDKLPSRQRQVFVLRYYDELSYQEMADILGTSVGSLKASYHHAVKKIEHYLINRML